MLTLEIELLKHQYEFITDITTPHLGLVAGYGSGKTYAFVIKGLYMASLNVGHIGLMLEPTFTMVNDALIPMMDEVLAKTGLEYKFRQSPQPEYHIKFATGWSTIKLRSAENWKRLAGINASWFGVDEVDTITNKDMTLKMWRMLISRVRKGNVFQGFTTSTPEGYRFLYEYFVQEKNEDGTPKSDRRLIRAKTQDNPFLPQTEYDEEGNVIELGYVDKLRSEYPANLIEAYLQGEFINLTSGNVYSNFDRKVNATTKTVDDFPKHLPIHMGVDFNIGKMATNYSIVYDFDQGGRIYTIDESWGCRDTEELIAETKRRFPGRDIYVYPDSSVAGHTGISDIALFKQAGFRVFANTKNPPVDHRIGSVQAMLKNGMGKPRLFVNVERCPRLVRSFEQQGYVDNKPDKSNDLDHPVDAIGYFVYKEFPLRSGNDRPKIKVGY